jgi:hypothetical protein
MQDVEADGDNALPATLMKGTIHDGTSVPGAIDSLVPDPSSPDGIFVNEYRSSVVFSADLGKSWKSVRAPHGVSSFSVAGDPLAASMLVATASGKFPPDRRWYSQDGGKHWTVGVCAGDYQGVCPSAILPAGTPGGISVAITTHGLFAFKGHAPASGRAAFRLPVAAGAVLEVQGDLKPGNVAYVLARGRRAGATPALYRSLNSGATWTVVRYPAS